MLRGVMTDPRTDSDARFFRMLRDFMVKYQGQIGSPQRTSFITRKSI